MKLYIRFGIKYTIWYLVSITNHHDIFLAMMSLMYTYIVDKAIKYYIILHFCKHLLKKTISIL